MEDVHLVWPDYRPPADPVEILNVADEYPRDLEVTAGLAEAA